MDRAKIFQIRRAKKMLVWAFWLANVAVIMWFWWQGSGQLLGSEPFLATARLAGLLATFCALIQFVLMGRVGWLEPIFGLDRLAIFHRRNGMATITLILLHSTLMIVGYSNLTSLSFIEQAIRLAQTVPFVPLAIAAEMLFVTVVASSIYIARKHLRFETWYWVHVLTYAAITLAFWHQFAVGSDLLANQVFWWYWATLYIFTLLNVVIWRVVIPTVRSRYHGFVVQKVVPETPTATSLYITGKHLGGFMARGGKFVMIRILVKGLWTQEHPFSLSMLPNSDHFRVTIRQLGDFTNQIPRVKPGTRVLVSGPYGGFTNDLQRTGKVVYVAGGIGITPVRAMLEERAQRGDKTDIILLYGNRSQEETALWHEVAQLGDKLGVQIFNILSEQPDYKGEKGFIDKERIIRLVPDIAMRDVFLCGPPAMVQNVLPALKELGVPNKYIHREQFSLHKQ